MIRQTSCPVCGAAVPARRRDRKDKRERVVLCSERCRRRRTYARQLEDPVTRNCLQCSASFSSTNPRQVTCSKRCSVRRSFTAQEQRRAAQRRASALPSGLRACSRCSADFEPRHLSTLYCSGCQRLRKSGNARSRARLYGVRYERVNTAAVFIRDEWVCQLCGSATLKAERGTWHPLAPEIDHIIPMSRGGPHTFDNVQCVHRQCNEAKGAGGGRGGHDLWDVVTPRPRPTFSGVRAANERQLWGGHGR